ncbi:phosphatidylinositol-glycan biosynthesis class S protein [Thelonectria olida]|uniref:Phosphatidylinositol-glycan biosynthesis class S protein n=1 Tax=Thelonectria olida TaxID=1576542 RepID=A0A9P8VUU4_9HYPO|nr:phosphatidylinositol-glycan biosynthesis class S protein [Thelonectria olida]
MASGTMASGTVAESAPAPAETSSSSSSKLKLPPPEKPLDIKRRSFIVLSFWLIVLFLGLPIWWKTTTIVRANLPLDGMLQWAEGKACRPVFPLQISIKADSLQENDAQNLVRLTQHALDDHNDFSGHHLRLQLAPKSDTKTSPDDSQVALTIQLTPGETNSASLNPHSAVLDIAYPPNSVPSPSSSSSTLATYIAHELQSTFSEEQSIISYLLSTSSSPDPRSQNLSPETAESLSKRTTRSLRYAPTYHLTFSLFTAGAVPNTWDIQTAIEEYMKPMLDVLGPIHNFTIDTQVQLYATPGAQSDVLSKADLASFINAAEWPLSPSIGGAPTVNFIIYTGNQNISLNSEAETSQSWMIPQWGSVYLLSLPDTASHVSMETLRQPMLTFNNHLLSLLGTPQSGSLPLRLSTLSRIRSADLILRASSTLGSLARLSLALPSISIPRSVADGVASTMDHLQQACGSLGGPQGLYHARIAEEEAERAFFEKSMVSRLYFPDEHKIAVYLPLLGPVGVPLVMGLVNELKRLIKRRRERAKEAKEKKTQ